MHPTLTLAWLGLALSATGSGDEHLLAGASAFREERYDTALVEFRVAQSLGLPEAATYAAATLVKLNRPEDAIEIFGLSDVPGPDALIDYYRALACYDARLFLCADRLLSGIGDRSGPRIAEEAAKARSAIAAELAKEPSHQAIDYYLSRCTAQPTSQPVVAAAHCREAAGLAARRSDQYRRKEAEAAWAKAEAASKRAGARR